MAGEAIVLIPGIKGTKLVDTNRSSYDVIWSGIQSSFETIEDLELTQRYDEHYFDEKRRVIIRPGEIEALAYGEFFRETGADKPIYIFSYDWRMSAVENGRKLADFLDYLIDKSHASRTPGEPINSFNFVTHSLGNAVFRAFINEYELDLVNKVVFTVPPFRGSLDIIEAALVGQGLFGTTKQKTRKIIRTMPGALELVPTYEHAACFTTGNSVVDFRKASHWQTNVTQTDDNDSDDKKWLARKFKDALSIAAQTINEGLFDLTELPKKVRDRMLIIVRHGSETLQSVDVIRNPDEDHPKNPKNLVDLHHPYRSEHGDGTVPHASSCVYARTDDSGIVTLAVTDKWYRLIGRAINPLDDRHAFVLNDERVQRLISRFFDDADFDYHSPGDEIKRVAGLISDPKKRTRAWLADM